MAAARKLLYNTVQHQIAIIYGWWPTQPIVGSNRCTKQKRPICGFLPQNQNQVAIAIGYNLNTSTWVMVVVVIFHYLMMIVGARNKETDATWFVESAILVFAGCVVNHGPMDAANATVACHAEITAALYQQMTPNLVLSLKVLEPECVRDAPCV
jgi:hypothetical protein